MATIAPFPLSAERPRRALDNVAGAARTISIASAEARRNPATESKAYPGGIQVRTVRENVLFLWRCGWTVRSLCKRYRRSVAQIEEILRAEVNKGNPPSVRMMRRAA